MNVLENDKREVSKGRFDLKRDLWYNYKVVALVGIVMLIVGCMRRISHGDPGNNFLIFAYSADHFFAKLNLYAAYPNEYFDKFFYGPLFALLIAPFAALPRITGVVCWVVVSALTAWFIGRYALTDFPKHQRTAFLWIIVNELFLSLLMQQYNTLVACFMLIAFLFTEREKHMWGTFFIALGTLTKIYGGIGFLLFPFVRKKKEFILWSIFWMVILGFMPALFSSPSYLWDQYVSWFEVLKDKNAINNSIDGLKQNMGFIGFVQRITGHRLGDGPWLILLGGVMLLLPLLRFEQYKHKSFRYLFLASTMLFVVLFSTGTESNTYIIGYMGIAIWWIITCMQRSKPELFDIIIFIGAMLFSHCTGDLFPRTLRDSIIVPYSLKSLFPMIIWLRIIYILLRDDHARYHIAKL